MTEPFTMAGYCALLATLRDRGHAFRGFDDAEPGSAHVVLRHDVDMALGPAVEMAAAEQGMGASATYFVLLRSELYNPFAPESVQAMTAIRALGHEIGLHLDASLCGEEPEALDRAAGRECAMLEQMAGHPVRMISFHRPAKSLLGHAADLAGRRHAYQPRFFSAMGYCSDSRGAWHHGAPLDHPAIAAGTALQLLTHPIWWARPDVEPQARLHAFLERRHARLDRALAENCDIHVPRTMQ